MKAHKVDITNGLTTKEQLHYKSLRQTSYTVVTAEPNISRLHFESVHKKVIALFIDGVKLSTLKSSGQYGLIRPLDSYSQFTLQLRAGRIKSHTVPYYSINASDQADKNQVIN